MEGDGFFDRRLASMRAADAHAVWCSVWRAPQHSSTDVDRLACKEEHWVDVANTKPGPRRHN